VSGPLVIPFRNRVPRIDDAAWVAPTAVIIGANVTIGHMCLIHACALEDACFIGMKACVMDGAVVETGAWVAAGAVVTPGKRVPKGQLWAGTPARYLRDVTEEEARYIEELPRHYAQLAAAYRYKNGDKGMMGDGGDR
jgi:gamma-carbonic anhydrase